MKGPPVLNTCVHKDRRAFARLGIEVCGAVALLPADAPDLFDLLFEVSDAAVDLSAIRLELRLTRTARADAASEL